MKIIQITPFLCSFIFITILISSCTNDEQSVLNKNGTLLIPAESLDLGNEYRCWDSVYLPVYTAIFTKSYESKFQLTVTISIRNTDVNDSITIHSVNHYDNIGQLTHIFVSEGLVLKPLCTKEFVLEENAGDFGVSSSIVVVWSSRKTVTNPIIQGFLVSIRGGQGISAITDGISIRRTLINDF
ncbi:MAG: DUF3124 domain-containing protein [Bacteroidales bacterium]|nr:DUF3124 domain-containing protein [Bacteroidales bacterium]